MYVCVIFLLPDSLDMSLGEASSVVLFNTSSCFVFKEQERKGQKNKFQFQRYISLKQRTPSHNFFKTLFETSASCYTFTKTTKTPF